jgi:hypothetical protein
VPQTPSQRLGHPVSPELESAVMACLEKNRAKRPQTARDLVSLFNRSPAAGAWTVDDAEAWWGRHERSQAGETAVGAGTLAPSAGISSAGISSAGMQSAGGLLTAGGNSGGPPTASAGLDRTMHHESSGD